MEGVLVVLAVLACPLVMLAMGAVAWVKARSRGEDTKQGDEGFRSPAGPEAGGHTRRT